MTAKWFPEDIALLRRMWAHHRTPDQIAEMLGRSRFTARMVRHKAETLRLQRGTPTAIVTRSGISLPPVIGQDKPPFVAPLPFPAGPPRENCTLIELQALQCRWPVARENNTWIFCGRKRNGGNPYCDKHHKLAVPAPLQRPGE